MNVNKIIGLFVGLIGILIVGIIAVSALPALGVNPLSNLGVPNPLAAITDGLGVNATNAAIDASGLKGKVEDTLRNNTAKLSAATGMSESEVNAAIDELDIQNWKATEKPEGVSKTGSYSGSYGGTQATVTTYDDPTIVTVDSMGQEVTMQIPESAQQYLPYLGMLQ